MAIVNNPGKAAGDEARRLHREAFPESYQEEAGKNGNPEKPEEGAAPETKPLAEGADSGENPEHKETPPVKPQEKDADYWRHRYEVMQGKYNAEVPRLTGQVNQLAERVNTLSADLQTAQQNKGAADTTGKTVDEALDDLAEQYGEQFVAAIDRRIDSRLDGRLNDKFSTIEQRMQRVEQTTTQSGINASLDQLYAAGRIPDWRALNEDPDFITWLQNEAPFSGGKTFQQIIKSAYQAGDVAGTAEIFNVYDQTNNKQADPAPAKQNKPEPPVSPPKRGGGVQSQIDNASGDVLRVSDFQQLMQDKINGRYHGKEAEFEKKKAEFYKAKAEGRLIG